MADRARMPERQELTFEGALGTLNVLTGAQRTETFGRLVVSEAQRLEGRARVLDVGCGSGLSVNDQDGVTALNDIRACVAELCGCEPDPAVVPSPLLDRFERGTLEDVSFPTSHFDIIYAHYVVEHVTNPAEFLRKALSLLRPGGRLIFMTPNARHYFVKVSRVLSALRIESLILKVLNPKRAARHYPTKYLLNDARDIASLAAAAGFSRCECAYFEHGDARSYFPRGFHWLPVILERVLVALGSPERLPGLVARLEK